MAHVLMPLPALDFDPTEAGVSWAVLRGSGHTVSFATPDGRAAQADGLMLSGRGLDPWGWVPGLRRLPLMGRLLRADARARAAYAAMAEDAAFRAPRRWVAIDPSAFDGLLLPGGHRARGMRPYLESTTLQGVVRAFFAADKPVAAICHGVLLAARTLDPVTGRSVLHGRKTTALTWRLERSADGWARIGRFWDPGYYRTYADGKDQPKGFMSVEAETTRALAQPDHFRDAPVGDRRRSGLRRDGPDDPGAAFVVVDGRYVSARWPGDAHTFAKTFARLLDAAPPL